MAQNVTFLTIKMLDGDATGSLIITIPTWDGTLYRVRRDDLNLFKSDPMLKQCGIYLLFGEKDGKPVVYIGQANARKNGKGVLGRVIEHRKPAEEYWDEAFMVVSKTDTISATELNYLENQCCNKALASKQYEVVNAVDPSTGHYSDMVEAVMDVFIDGLSSILSLLQYNVFMPPKTKKSQVKYNDADKLYIKRSNDPARIVDAVCVRTEDSYILLKGSIVALTPTNSCQKYIKDSRARNANKIDASGKVLEDISFDKPSGASSFALFASSNGNREWKDASGKCLNDILDGK